MKSFLTFTLLFILLCFSLLARAVEVGGLNSSAVPVTIQSKSNLHQALEKALLQVLIKQSGDATISQNPNINQILSNADDYVQQYSYANQTQPDGSQQLLLSASFDKSGIKQMLSQLGESAWGSDRPLVLAWIAIRNQDSQGDDVIISSNPDAYATALSQAAKLRGVPLLYPVLDLQDMQLVDANNICQFDDNNILQASKRYVSDAILIGCVIQTNHVWQSKWQLITQNQKYVWLDKSPDIKALFLDNVDQLSTRLASNYDGDDSSQQDVSNVNLIVVNINTLNTYAEVKKYLEQLSLVKQVEISSISPDKVAFVVSIVGNESALTKALTLDHMLIPINSTGDDNVSNNLMYKWVS